MFKKPHVVPGVQQSYESAFNAHIVPALGDKRLGAITPTDLQKLLTGLWDMPYTCEAVHLYLKQVFRYALANRYIEYDPTIALRKPVRPRTNRRALTDQETTAALEVGATHPDGLFLLVLYYLGLRRGEALGLKWKDFNLRGQTVTISRDIDYKAGATEGELKTKAAYRTIPVPDQLIERLRPVVGLPEVYVFQSTKPGQPLPESTYQRKWAALMSAMYEVAPSIEYKQLASGTRRSILTPHYFRHNYASLLYNADVDVLSAKKWLGHANVATALGIYAHLGAGKEDKNIVKLKKCLYL